MKVIWISKIVDIKENLSPERIFEEGIPIMAPDLAL